MKKSSIRKKKRDIQYVVIAYFLLLFFSVKSVTQLLHGTCSWSIYLNSVKTPHRVENVPLSVDCSQLDLRDGIQLRTYLYILRLSLNCGPN